MLLSAVPIFIVVLGASKAAETRLVDFPYHANLDLNGVFQLFWKFDNDTITFHYQALSKGWAGIGFSPSGAMTGADIVVLWVDPSGKGMISDRHAKQNGFPEEDTHQDYALLDIQKNSTHILATFSRNRSTCDPEDYTLTDDTTRVIYAAQDSIPEGKNSFRRHSIRASKSLYLFNKKLVNDGSLPEKDIRSLDFLVNKVSVPDNIDTLYWCEVMRMPKMTKKTHIVKVEPIIEPQNVRFVHHIIVYVCSQNMTSFLSRGRSCFDENNNEDAALGKCKEQVLAAWATGGQSVTYPNDVGVPLYEDVGDMYVMMEMHYDNSQFQKGVVDSSGMRVWITEQLRQYDADQAMIGIDVGAAEQVIPPGVSEFTNYAYCSADCTSGFPKTGVKVIGGLMHTHLAGRKVRLLHFRNGKQLPNIISDEHYDFNYQDYRRKDEPSIILPNDQLVVECVYETKGRNKTTFSGWSTHDEMCEVYIDYYPATYRGFLCISSPDKRQLYKILGIAVEATSSNKTFENLVRLPNGQMKPLPKYLKEDFVFDWTPEKISAFQAAQRNLKHEVTCMRDKADKNGGPADQGDDENGTDFFEQYGYPNVTEALVSHNACPSAEGSHDSTTSHPPQHQALHGKNGGIARRHPNLMCWSFLLMGLLCSVIISQ